MRLATRRHVGYYFRKLQDHIYQNSFGFLLQQLQMLLTSLQVLVFGSSDYAGTTHMGILNVRRRILTHVLGHRCFQVKVHLRVGGPLQEEESNGVCTHFINKLS